MKESSKDPYDLIVIGGGASGMMAAGRAKERGLSVLLLEKNKRLGEKLRITGGGRCNITNRGKDERVLLKKYGNAEQFLYSLFVQFGVQETFAFFESRNLPLVVEANNRVFPKSQKAQDVVNILIAYLEKGGVDVVTSSPVNKVVTKDTKIVSVVCGAKEYFGKEFLFATGGISHQETGATSDGFTWLKTLGHTVHAPTPTIVPLSVSEKWVKDLAGMSYESMKINFYVNEKKSFALKGRILFTHFGISGPLILNNAYKVSDLLHEGVVTATIDLFPELDSKQLDQMIVDVFDNNKNKDLKNILKEIVGEGVHKGVATLLENDFDIHMKIHSVSKDQRKHLVRLLKALPLTITGLMGFDRAVIADGGIPLDEVDLRTMRSKKVPNLFVTGDLLHINRPSGGY